MNTANGPGSATTTQKHWSAMSNKDWRMFLANKGQEHGKEKAKEIRKGWEAQLLAVLSYGNQIARCYARKILGEYQTYSLFHTILAKLDRLDKTPFAPDCTENTAQVFNMSVAALREHLADHGNNELDALCKLLRCEPGQLREIISIPAEDKALINIWREVCPILQAQYEPMMERISKNLFQQWFVIKQSADRSDCFGDTGTAICKAVRGYRNTKVKFLTYAWNTTYREIKRAIHRKFGKTAMSAKLMGEYADTERRLLTAGHRATQEDVFAQMNLKPSQIAALKRSLKRQMMQEGELEKPLDELVAGRVNNKLPHDWLALIQSVGLSDLEFAAFKAEEHLREYFDDENFSDVARRLGYSAQAVGDALKRARLKIANKLLSRVRFTSVERAAFEGRLVGKTFDQIATATGLPRDGLETAYRNVMERINGTIGTIYGLAQ